MSVCNVVRIGLVLAYFALNAHMAVAQDAPTVAELARQTEVINAQVTLLRAEAARIEAQRALERAQAEGAGLVAEVTAQTALLTAETAKENAERALAAAQAQVAKTLDEVNAKKSLTTAEKELATAEKDLAIAESQAAAAELFGDVKSASYSGAVEIKDKGGLAETFLLASNAERRPPKISRLRFLRKQNICMSFQPPIFQGSSDWRHSGFERSLSVMHSNLRG